MGQAESKGVIEDEQYIALKQIAETKGPAAVSEYLRDNVHKWKEEKVLFAVTGRSATGKSTFINKIRDVKPSDPGFAKCGSGNTTLEPTAYENPQNKRIVFYDLPGVGTMEFPKEKYVSKMKLQQYNYFFIFFDKVVSEDDYFLIHELLKLEKSFCLVRSKIDEDLRNAEEDGKTAEEVLPEIRKKIVDQVSRYEHLRNTDTIFLLSSRSKTTGDWYKLLEHIGNHLPAPKFESFMSSLPTLTEKVINIKYTTLQKRLRIATAAAAGVGAVPLPGVNIVANIAILVQEVKHYINMFGFDKNKLTSLNGFDQKQLKCACFLVPNADLAKVITTQFGKFVTVFAVRSVGDLLLPIIGSVIFGVTSAVLTYRYLSKTLDDFKDDAFILYKYILHNQRI